MYRNPNWKPFKAEASTAARLDYMSRANAKCWVCGTPVFTIPEEDGDGPFACGRCNKTGMARPYDRMTPFADVALYLVADNDRAGDPPVIPD